MKKTIIAILVCIVSLMGCTNPSSAHRVLDSQGFKNIRLNGYVVFGCSEDDQYHDSFTATSASGKTVTGIVCGSPFKGSTIRFD